MTYFRSFLHKVAVKIDFDDFYDHGVDVWIQGLSERVFRMTPGPDFIFVWVWDLGMLEVVAGIQRYNTDHDLQRS